MNQTLDEQLGLTHMWAVGFGSITNRPCVYQVYVLGQMRDKYVDKIRAAYDGEAIHPRALTPSMVVRGRGISRIPMYAICRRMDDAEKYADDLMVVVQRKTTNNIKMFARDPSTATKRMWKELFRGLWSIPVPEWR